MKREAPSVFSRGVVHILSIHLMKKLTEQQKKLLVMFAKKSKLDPNFVIKNVED
jgi:hypothetical protein